jgi:hypothetical protein
MLWAFAAGKARRNSFKLSSHRATTFADAKRMLPERVRAALTAPARWLIKGP